MSERQDSDQSKIAVPKQNPPEECWYLSPWGPARVKVHLKFRKMAVVSALDSPEVVRLCDLFETRQNCYRQAASREHATAAEAMKKAAEYIDEANTPSTAD